MSDATARDAVRGLLETRPNPYLKLHARRFELLLETCMRLAPSRATRIADVGWSQLTQLLLPRYDRVFTIGYGYGDDLDRGLAGHITFDLNRAFGMEAVETEERFDLIVFAETIEHLIVPPDMVLRLLGGLLVPGGRMICQTPNAAALGNRVKLLCGYNPYEKLRPTEFNLGHIRESTGAELKAAARMAGLEVEHHTYYEYAPWPDGMAARLGEGVIRSLSALFPRLRRGQMAILRRPMAGSSHV